MGLSTMAVCDCIPPSTRSKDEDTWTDFSDLDSMQPHHILNHVSSSDVAESNSSDE
jgi:hypothetical protein